MNPVTNASGMNDTPSRVTYFNTNPNPTRHKIPILMTEKSLTYITEVTYSTVSPWHQLMMNESINLQHKMNESINLLQYLELRDRQ